MRSSEEAPHPCPLRPHPLSTLSGNSGIPGATQHSLINPSTAARARRTPRRAGPSSSRAGLSSTKREVSWRK